MTHGVEDLKVLLGKVDLSQPNAEAFIIVRTQFHSQALYLKNINGQVKSYFADSMIQSSGNLSANHQNICDILRKQYSEIDINFAKSKFNIIAGLAIYMQLKL